MIFIIVILLVADQHAITDNEVEVILKDDSTWAAVDSIAGQISPFATTEDSQMVYLKKDGTWEYMEKDSTDIDSIPEPAFLLEKFKPELPEVEVILYSQLEVKPKPLYSPVPVYPERAKHEGIEGMSVVKMLIDFDGTVMKVEIFKTSGNPWLDEAALTAAKKSLFSPAEENGKKVRVWVTRPFKFKLH